MQLSVWVRGLLKSSVSFFFYFSLSLSVSFGARAEGGKLDFAIAKDLFEKEFIVQALKLNKGRINQTALNANIPKKTLLRKIEKYEINPKEYY